VVVAVAGCLSSSPSRSVADTAAVANPLGALFGEHDTHTHSLTTEGAQCWQRTLLQRGASGRVGEFSLN